MQLSRVDYSYYYYWFSQAQLHYLLILNFCVGGSIAQLYFIFHKTLFRYYEGFIDQYS